MSHDEHCGVKGQHCDCWYDGKPCCRCNAPAMSDDEKREQGMEVVPYGWYSPKEFRFISNTPGEAWKAENRIQGGYEMIPLFSLPSQGGGQ